MVPKTKENGKCDTPENALGALELAMAGDSKRFINKNVDNKNVGNNIKVCLSAEKKN